MSRQSRLDGLEGALAMFGSVPDAAREELAVEMGLLGREILAAQKADVAKDTGETAASLSLALLVEQLKVRIGALRGKSSSRGSRAGFKPRLIEFGREAQTVLVTRHLKAVRRHGNNRKGNTRRTTWSGKPYKMRVKAMAGRPFIAQPLLQDAAELHLSEYWSKVLTRAGAGG